MQETQPQQENWGDVVPFTGPPVLNGGKLPPNGKTLVKIEAPYQTALTVQKPRDIDKVQRAVLREAEYAGEDFFYSWTVKGKKGPQTIQGPSIGLAMCVAREWTNCAVDVSVEPAGTHDIFTTAFIDLERGFTAKRAFKQRKTLAPGRYDAERWEDMEFQKAQSKAIRNVIVSGVPRWLVNQAIEKAKQAVLDKISKQGIEQATQKAIQFLGNYGISEERIIARVGKPKSEWVSEDIMMLRGCASELKDGQVSADELFPPEIPPTNNQDAPGQAETENEGDNAPSEKETPESAKVGQEFAKLTGMELSKFWLLRDIGVQEFAALNKVSIPTWPDHIQKIVHDKFAKKPEWAALLKPEQEPQTRPKDDNGTDWNGLVQCPQMDGNNIPKMRCKECKFRVDDQGVTCPALG